MSWLNTQAIRAGFVVASIGAAAIVSAVSLTRIAGDHLGFPDGLEWTFTAAADIGSIAGAIGWVRSEAGSRARHSSVTTNIACSAVSALFVGLDHAANASPGWTVVAFIVGAFLPLLSTGLVHDLVQNTASPAKPPARRPAAPRPAAKPKTVAQAIKEMADTANEAPEPPKPSKPHAVPSPGSPAEWAMNNWPCTPDEVMAAMEKVKGEPCSRATAYRAVRNAREHAA